MPTSGAIALKHDLVKLTLSWVIRGKDSGFVKFRQLVVNELPMIDLVAPLNVDRIDEQIPLRQTREISRRVDERDPFLGTDRAQSVVQRIDQLRLKTSQIINPEIRGGKRFLFFDLHPVQRVDSPAGGQENEGGLMHLRDADEVRQSVDVFVVKGAEVVFGFLG